MFLSIILMNRCSFPAVDLEKLRIPGVLQRLSLSYFIIALMETVFAKREDKFKVIPSLNNHSLNIYKLYFQFSCALGTLSIINLLIVMLS